MKKLSTKTSSKTVYKITASDIIEALRKTGKIPKNGNCELVFCVPGGGDYSNMELDVAQEPLKLTIESN